MAGKQQPLEQRFWRYVDKRDPSECWTWTGSTNWKGYGRIAVERRNRPAPQVAWELANGGPFPHGKFACHSCDNPSCVNPAHIWPGTAAENQADSIIKGRRLHLVGKPRARQCPNCGYCLAPPSRTKRPHHPAPQGAYAGWTTTRATRNYDCCSCGRLIAGGDLHANARLWTLNGVSLGGRRFFRACAECAGITPLSERIAA